MRIDVIDNGADFERVRDNWGRVYMSDPHAQHFLSWIWLREFLSRKRRWFILALREREPGSPYVAFFPLRMSTTQDPKTGIFTDDIIMAGNYAADYTGFIAEPGYEDHAIKGFSAFLKSQNWTNLKLEYFFGPPERKEAMLRAFQGSDFRHRDSTPKSSDNLDICLCPVVTLPDSWETYLETKMSSQSRQKLRRFLRKIESDETYRITHATPETIKRDLDVLFSLWRIKWLPRKGEPRIDRLITATREMLMDCFNDGNLDVPVFWYGDRPLGALANIVDRQKKAILFYITGRDEEWKTPSPGLILHGYSIRRAIADGFKSYDFLRGNEPYKYMFGADERPISCTIIATRTGRNLGDKLHPRSIRHVYERGTHLYKTGAKRGAEIAFQQVCEAAPEHMGARFGLARLLFDRGMFAQAEAAYKEIATKVTDPVPVLVGLGDTQLALRHFDDAAATFQRVVELHPHHSQAHFKRGVALLAAHRPAEAAKAFGVLEQFHSDDPAHASYRDKARRALARINPVNAAREPALDPARPPLEMAALIAAARPARSKDLKFSTATLYPKTAVRSPK